MCCLTGRRIRAAVERGDGWNCVEKSPLCAGVHALRWPEPWGIVIVARQEAERVVVEPAPPVGIVLALVLSW